VVVDDCAIISAEVLVHQFVHIGGYVMIQGGSRTSQDIPPYVIAGKEPIRFAGLNLIGLRRRGFPNETILAIREAYNTIYSKGLIKEGIEEVKKTMELIPEIKYVIDFIEKAERGIIR
jgi:UDP-N-acetylglucosamine acyltransferase